MGLGLAEQVGLDLLLDDGRVEEGQQLLQHLGRVEAHLVRVRVRVRARARVRARVRVRVRLRVGPTSQTRTAPPR